MSFWVVTPSELVGGWAGTNILVEHTDCVFRVEVLNMEAIRSFETLVYTCESTRCENPVDQRRHVQCLENLLHIVNFCPGHISAGETAPGGDQIRGFNDSRGGREKSLPLVEIE